MNFSLRTLARLLALFILSTGLSWWWFSGADMGWTKTYVTIPATDDVTGIQYEVKKEKFVPGVDFLALGTGLSFVIFATTFLFSAKNPTTMKIQALAVAALLSTQAFADEVAFDFKDPKGVNNIVFKLDAPLESISGTTNGISGSISADPAEPEDIEGKIIVDARTLSVPNPLMQEHMLGAEWLDTAKHPEITFEIKEVLNSKKEGNTGTAEVKGIFTMKGISKEVLVPVSVTYLPGRLADRTGGKVEGDLLVVRTNFQINRGDYGIKQGENLDKVSDVIDISLALAGAAPKK